MEYKFFVFLHINPIVSITWLKCTPDIVLLNTAFFYQIIISNLGMICGEANNVL